MPAETEIILFGDEKGTSKACDELNVRNIGEIELNEHGTPLLNYIFDKGQDAALSNIVCYANADIIFLSDLIDSIQDVVKWNKVFLIVGRRIDLDVNKPIDFSEPDYEKKLRKLAYNQGVVKSHRWIDYFIFPKGLFKNILPFLVGRPGWDNWFIWHAMNRNIPVVDATESITAIHQNHDYSHHKQGREGVWNGIESEYNFNLLGSYDHYYSIAFSDYLLKKHKVIRNLTREHLKIKFRMWKWIFLNKTKGIRHQLGFNHININKFKNFIKNI